MIRLDSVSKVFPDGHVAVDALSLDVPEGEICVLVGPSGCGKTTTLRMINRLIEPTSGRIFLNGEDVTDVNPVLLRRRIGYVIQQVGLFPHQTIAENIGTVPRLLGWDRARVKARVDELLELVGLDPGRYRRRYPHQLSGGQRQRVGVARALGADPSVLLMDEPFGAIDPITRDRLQQEFLRLQAEVRKTVVFVTHDIEEAVRLGDRIAILADGGHLAQYATPNELLGNPASPFVAEFVGTDRGLKRLEVTGIDRAALAQPPVVPAGTSAADAQARINGQASPIAIVVDAQGRPTGWVAKGGVDEAGPSTGSAGAPAGTTGAESDGTGSGDAPDGVQRLDATATVPATGSLKDALSALLLADTGWVAVVDEDDRYVGVATPETVHLTTRQS